MQFFSFSYFTILAKLPINFGYNSYCDHYIISSINSRCNYSNKYINHERSLRYLFRLFRLFNNSIYFADIKFPLYLFDISEYILLPNYSYIKCFLYSFDVIHTLGFYSWGIKIDAIPGRINLATTLRLLWKGEYRGKCFELCGQGHVSMMVLSLILLFIYELVILGFLVYYSLIL